MKAIGPRSHSTRDETALIIIGLGTQRELPEGEEVWSPQNSSSESSFFDPFSISPYQLGRESLWDQYERGRH